MNNDFSICDPEDFAEFLKETARQYTDEVCEELESGLEHIAAETLEEVKALSPVYDGDYTPKPNGQKLEKNRAGAYKKGWTTTTEKKNGTFKITVHNKKFSLVHLLELGHLLKDGTGRVYGEVSPRVHVETAEKHADEKIDRLLEELTNGT